MWKSGKCEFISKIKGWIFLLIKWNLKSGRNCLFRFEGFGKGFVEHRPLKIEWAWKKERNTKRRLNFCWVIRWLKLSEKWPGKLIHGFYLCEKFINWTQLSYRRPQGNHKIKLNEFWQAKWLSFYGHIQGWFIYKTCLDERKGRVLFMKN